MQMRTMLTIRADMRNQVYNLPDWVGKTSYQCDYTSDRDLDQLYCISKIDLHKKFSQIQVSHEDYPRPLSSLCFLSSILP